MYRKVRRSEEGGAATRPIVVFGSGRSGTTWLAEIIAAAGCRLLFEPLHPIRMPEARDFPFPHYLLPGDESPWETFLARVVAGDVMNEFVLRDNPGSTRPVVKLIRANLMMAWLIDRFDIDPVFMVRNPLAVVGSMKEQEWDVSLEYVRHSMREVTERDGTYDGFEDILERELTPTEVLALFWCDQNYVPKRQGVLSRVSVVRFEDLVRDPERVVAPLLERLGLPMTDAVRKRFSTLSFQRGKQTWRAGYDPLRTWTESLTPREVVEVRRMVRRFGLEEYLDTE